MIYRITFVQASDYCQIRPGDKDCLFTVDIDAPSKTEAIIKYHSIHGVYHPIRKSVLPEVWTIEEINRSGVVQWHQTVH